MDTQTKNDLAYKIKLEDWLDKNNCKSRHDSLESLIATILSSQFALTDIIRNAEIFTNADINLALRVDPLFNDKSKKTLYEAAKIFISIALDTNVINEAINNSIQDPTPEPDVYVENARSSDNLNVYTSKYKFFLKCRSKPKNAQAFIKQLKTALGTEVGDPGLLLISAYDGDCWWGLSWYNYRYQPIEQLSRLSPSQGYLSVAFNYDSLKIRQDPVFWSSKIAHEVLHNLGYYHPAYKNPRERDINNQGDEKAFIVAYEFAILKKARELYTRKERYTSK
jgi:hypothetical protein